MSTDIELKTVEKERDKELSPTSKRKKEKESGKDKPGSYKSSLRSTFFPQYTIYSHHLTKTSDLVIVYTLSIPNIHLYNYTFCPSMYFMKHWT